MNVEHNLAEAMERRTVSEGAGWVNDCLGRAKRWRGVDLTVTSVSHQGRMLQACGTTGSWVLRLPGALSSPMGSFFLVSK